jgi:D-arabinono-1,4-lactone oxidase
MRDLGGRPHWAKNFDATGREIEEMYGEKLLEWRKIRNDADPEGMFVGEWHRRYIMGEGRKLALEEVEVGRENLWKGGVLVTGEVEDDRGLSGNTSEESFDHLRESDVTVKG